MKDAKEALEKVHLMLRLLSRDGMKPETAAWLDKAQKTAKDALGDAADGAVYYTPQTAVNSYLKEIADAYGIKIGDEPSGFEKFLTVSDGVQFVRFAGRDEIKLVSLRVGKSGNANTIFEIMVDKAAKVASVWRDSRILFEVKGVSVGYSQVEKMALSALRSWFKNQRKNTAARRRKRKARQEAAAAEKAKEA